MWLEPDTFRRRTKTNMIAMAATAATAMMPILRGRPEEPSWARSASATLDTGAAAGGSTISCAFTVADLRASAGLVAVTVTFHSPAGSGSAAL